MRTILAQTGARTIYRPRFTEGAISTQPPPTSAEAASATTEPSLTLLRVSRRRSLHIAFRQHQQTSFQLARGRSPPNVR